jgi:hypothetical protein
VQARLVTGNNHEPWNVASALPILAMMTMLAMGYWM